MEYITDATLPLLLGVIFVGVGVFFWWQGKRQRRLCTSVVGGVVADEGFIVKQRKRERREGYQPTFSYSVEGVAYTNQLPTPEETKRFSMGQKVTVFYDPFKPKRSYVLEVGHSNLLILVPAFFGTSLLLIGLIISFVA